MVTGLPLISSKNNHIDRTGTTYTGWLLWLRRRPRCGGPANSNFDVLIRIYSIEINFKLILHVLAAAIRSIFSVWNNVSCSQAQNIRVKVAFSAFSIRCWCVQLCVIKRLNRFVWNNSLRTIVLTEQNEEKKLNSILLIRTQLSDVNKIFLPRIVDENRPIHNIICGRSTHFSKQSMARNGRNLDESKQHSNFKWGIRRRYLMKQTNSA